MYTKAQKKQIMLRAALYRKRGMDRSQALRKAYADYKK